jgi:hypothetical protein
MAAIGYVCVSALVGVFAGFQGIYERFASDSWKASITRWGLLYLATRGALAATAFFAVPLIPVLMQPPILRALAAGAGAEAILRSRFYFKRSKKKGTTVLQEIIRGPFDLLRFYQDFFLTTIEDNQRWATITLVESIAQRWKSFSDMGTVVERKLFAWGEEQEIAVALRKALASLRDRFEGDARRKEGTVDPSVIDREFRCQLCYKIEEHLGEKGLRKFFDE